MKLNAPEAGRPRHVLLAFMPLALLVAAVMAGVGAGPAEARRTTSPPPTGASPLLLLEGPGWRVQNTEEGRERSGAYGSMEFVTGKPIPYETITVRGKAGHETESGMFPAAVRQRRVDLEWRKESLAKALAEAHSGRYPQGRRWVEAPVLGTTAEIDTRAESFDNQGGPGDREMTALWAEAGDVYQLRAAVPDLAAFEERLGWLTKVDAQTWLAAMPAKVVAPGEYHATVREVLKGIPTPKTFSPSRVPDEELVTDRYQVGAQAAGTVACLWLRQWGAARRTGDTAAELEADKAMGTSRHWAVLREMTKEGAYSEVVWEIAEWMPKGYFEWDGHRRSLLAQAEGLGCALRGVPLLPRKMKIQRERGGPPPPR